MSCSTEITSGLTKKCKPLNRKIQSRLLLMNRDDLNVVTYDGTYTENLISAITKQTGKQAWLFEGNYNSTKGQDNGERNANGEFLSTHIIDFVAYNVNPLALKVLKELKNGKVFAFVEAGSQFWAVGGIQERIGLELQTSAMATDEEDSGGAYRLTLQATRLGEFWTEIGVYTGTAPDISQNYAASKAIFDGLLTPQA